MTPSTRLKLLTFAVALFVTLAAAELASRVFLPSPVFEPDDIALNRLSGLLVAHPTRGYAMAPNFSGTFDYADREIRLDTNSLGLRDGPMDKNPDGWTALAAGDSFTVGFRVEDREAWPAQAQVRYNFIRGHKPPLRVVNAGVTGYSLRQIRIAAFELADELTPDLLVVGVYPAGHWRIETPYVLFDGKLVLASVVPHLVARRDGSYLYSGYDGPWLRSTHLFLARWSRFGYYLMRAPRSLAARWGNRSSASSESPDPAALQRRLAPLLAELDLLAGEAKRRRLPILVVLINPQAEDGTFRPLQQGLNRIVRDHLKAADVACLDPLPALREAAFGQPVLRFDDDHHWTAEAHALVGAAVADALLDAHSPLLAKRPDHSGSDRHSPAPESVRSPK